MHNLCQCLLWQDVSPEDIPIMLVGNKCDLRQESADCVPTTYGEKLSMVIMAVVYTSQQYSIILTFCLSSLTDIQHFVL